jgi:hypothetical protein
VVPRRWKALRPADPGHGGWDSRKVPTAPSPGRTGLRPKPVSPRGDTPTPASAQSCCRGFYPTDQCSTSRKNRPTSCQSGRSSLSLSGRPCSLIHRRKRKDLRSLAFILAPSLGAGRPCRHDVDPSAVSSALPHAADRTSARRQAISGAECRHAETPGLTAGSRLRELCLPRLPQGVQGRNRSEHERGAREQGSNQKTTERERFHTPLHPRCIRRRRYTLPNTSRARDRGGGQVRGRQKRVGAGPR